MKGSKARSKLGMSGSARSSARSHQGSTRSKLGYDHVRASLADAARVQRVNLHPLKFGNGCNAPVLKRSRDESPRLLLIGPLIFKRENLFSCFYILLCDCCWESASIQIITIFTVLQLLLLDTAF